MPGGVSRVVVHPEGHARQRDVLTVGHVAQMVGGRVPVEAELLLQQLRRGTERGGRVVPDPPVVGVQQDGHVQRTGQVEGVFLLEQGGQRQLGVGERLGPFGLLRFG